MAFCYCSSSSSSSQYHHLILRRRVSSSSSSASSSFPFFPSSINTINTTNTSSSLKTHRLLLLPYRYYNNNNNTPIRKVSVVAAAATSSSRNTNTNPNTTTSSNNDSSSSRRKESSSSLKEEEEVVEEEEEEEEEELPWIQEKALDLVEFTGSVTQAIPGPRVGTSSLPWILALPLAYIGFTFVFAFVKTVRNFNSPKELRRKLVNKNAFLCMSIEELFNKKSDELQLSALNGLMDKTGFNMEEILRKYIRYALSEKPFNPDFVANLIQLRKASNLDDSQVTEILNEISRRIVKDKGPVVMDVSGYSEAGFKRKLAVQALFGKVYYLSELPEFCSRDNSLIVKEIFGVADEDADKLRLHTLSEAGDIDSLEKKMVDASDSKVSSDGGSTAQ